jgi:predicted ATPase
LALTGQWRYSFMTDKLSKTMQIANRIYSLAQHQNDPALMIGACRNLTFTSYYQGDFETALEYAVRGVQIGRSGSAQPGVEEINAPVVSCLVFEAMSEWHFGEIAYCKTTISDAIALAKELHDMHGLAVALLFAGILAHLQNDLCVVERMATDVIELSTRQNFAAWQAAGAVLRGWVRCRSGHPAEGISLIEGGIQGLQATGSILGVPYCLGLKAEALHFADRTYEALEAIKQAKALIERSEERWWYAELHRLHGVFLAALHADKSLIETSLSAAISTAKHQKSTSLATRAEASYAEYLN